jgi:hypothetical protein
MADEPQQEREREQVLVIDGDEYDLGTDSLTFGEQRKVRRYVRELAEDPDLDLEQDPQRPDHRRQRKPPPRVQRRRPQRRQFGAKMELAEKAQRRQKKATDDHSRS